MLYEIYVIICYKIINKWLKLTDQYYNILFDQS